MGALRIGWKFRYSNLMEKNIKYLYKVKNNKNNF